MTPKRILGEIQKLAAISVLMCFGCASSPYRKSENFVMVAIADGLDTLVLRGRTLDPISQQPVASATIEIICDMQSEYRTVAAATQSDSAGEFEIAWEEGWWSEDYEYPDGYPEEDKEEDACCFAPFTLVARKDGYLSYVRSFGCVPCSLPGRTVYAGTIDLQPLE